ncbi:MAG: hypothetical protein ACFFD2_00770 [Promethearchaeota archaeon]
MSVPEANQLFNVISHFEICFGYPIPTDKNRLDVKDTTRPNKQYGGFLQMSEIIKRDIQNLNSLFGDGLLPKRIYEIYIQDGYFKNYLIHTIPRAYERFAFICDCDFKSMEELVVHLEILGNTYNLLIFDISEILYLDFIKDYDKLRATLQDFYDRLGMLANLGTTSIVFTNIFFYHQIFHDIYMPETIQIHIYPSDVAHLWEAKFVNPPEWSGIKSLFSPFKDELPFLQF